MAKALYDARVALDKANGALMLVMLRCVSASHVIEPVQIRHQRPGICCAVAAFRRALCEGEKVSGDCGWCRSWPTRHVLS